MKKVTKYIALLIGGIALLSMAACSDDDGRTPSPAVDPNCIGASFVGDNIGYEELEDTDPKELTLTISRIRQRRLQLLQLRYRLIRKIFSTSLRVLVLQPDRQRLIWL